MIPTPKPEDLKALLCEAVGDGTESEYVARYLGTIKTLIKRDPRQYRAYSYFWWAIKLMLIKQGVDSFGSEVEADAIKMTQGLSEAQILVAAYATKSAANDDGRLYAADHLYALDNGETETYTVIDPELERWIVK